MDQKIIDLYDDFTHGEISRRSFLDRLTSLAGSAAAAAALLPLLQNNYALAQTVPEDDPRITTERVDVPGGQPGLKGYVAKPRTGDKLPTVLVVHENRGLNPHIRDVTRRFATEGFLALGIDFLSPFGGSPDDDDKGREMFAQVKAPEAVANAQAAIAYLIGRPDGNGKAGAVGFCFGGGIVNSLAVAEPRLAAGVAYYGRTPNPADVPKIKAAMLLHYGGLDQGVNQGIPAFEAALKQAGTTYELYVYEGANHAFNNETNAARYNKAAAELSWGRTIAWLKKHVA